MKKTKQVVIPAKAGVIARPSFGRSNLLFLKARDCFVASLLAMTPTFAGMTLIVAGWVFSCESLFAEAPSPIDTSIQEGSVIRIRLRDLRPTQPTLGFDEVYYRLGRYTNDRRKLFDEICEVSGQTGILEMSNRSDIKDPESFRCREPLGTHPEYMKTVVLAPNGQIYLTDGHHTFNTFWHMEDGGPDMSVNVLVGRDLRRLSSMEAFWRVMDNEKYVWLFDVEDKPISVAALPPSLGLGHFRDDPYRSLMYFTRDISWTLPQHITDPTTGDPYPAVPFAEFYWAREVRKSVDLSRYDLNKRSGYQAAIRAICEAVLAVQSNDVGGSEKTALNMGQYRFLDRKELERVERPQTGRLAYLLAYKAARQQGARAELPNKLISK